MQIVSVVLGNRHDRRESPADMGPPPWSARHTLPRFWWTAPLTVFVVVRLVNMAMMALASTSQTSMSQFLSMGVTYHVATAEPAPPGILAVATNWDGQWYWDIATRGYPRTLPRDTSGTVTFNAWAFYPLYPLTVRGLMLATGLEFPACALAASLLFGALASVVLHHMVARRHGQRAGLIAAILLNAFICAPVLQMAYAEAITLFLLLSTLQLVITRHYTWAATLMAPLALARGVIAPLAVALIAYTLTLRRHGWGDRKDFAGLSLLAGWAGVLSFAWIVTAALVTGTTDAFRATQRAWNPDIGVPAVLRFVRETSNVPGGVVTTSLVAVIFGMSLIAVLTVNQQEPLLRLWTAFYVLYLLAVVDWNPSSVRYFLLAPPILWSLVHRGDDRRTARAMWPAVMALVIVGLSLQWWWIRYTLVLSPELAQVP